MTTFVKPMSGSSGLKFSRIGTDSWNNKTTSGKCPVGIATTRITPGWRRFDRRKKIKPNSPYSKYVHEMEFSPASFGILNSNGIAVAYTTDLYVGDVSLPLWGDYQSRHSQWQNLEIACVSALNNRVVNVNAGTIESFVEANKTLDMVLGAAKKLLRCLYYIKRGKLSLAWKALGTTADRPNVHRGQNLATVWLEYRYGWTPLLLAIVETLKALWNECKTGQVKTCSTVHRARQILNGFSGKGQLYSLSGIFDCPGYGMDVNSSKTATESIQVSGGYIYEITHPNVILFEELGLINPLAVAWELVPLSFVADWFLNVGAVLESLTTFSGKRLISGYLSYKRTCVEFSRSSVSPGSSGNKLSGNLTATRKSVIMNFDRVPFTTQPTVSPLFSNGLNPRRILDAASLMRQFLK